MGDMSLLVLLQYDLNDKDSGTEDGANANAKTKGQESNVRGQREEWHP